MKALDEGKQIIAPPNFSIKPFTMVNPKNTHLNPKNMFWKVSDNEILTINRTCPRVVLLLTLLTTPQATLL